MRNHRGLDDAYFLKNLNKIITEIDCYDQAEMARALTRLAVVASAKDARSVIDGEAAPEPATVAVDAGALAELREALSAVDDHKEAFKSRKACINRARHRAEMRLLEAARRLLAGGE